MSSVAPRSTLDPEVAAAISRAEHRRGRLERLSDIGMDMAELVGAHAAASMAAVNEARGGDPCRAFAAVSRAVRMSMALETRLDQFILALLNGESTNPDKPRRAAPARASKAAEAGAPEIPVDSGKTSSPGRLRVRDELWEVMYREVESIDVAQRLIDRLDRGLFDTDEWDAAACGPLRDAVAAICADLGLTPDWSLWTDDAGFSETAPGRRVLWSNLCAHRPAGRDPPDDPD